MNDCAIIIICFDRVETLQKSFQSLLNNDFIGKTVDLIISIDNSGLDDVENLAKTFAWPYGKLFIRTFNERQGLKKHILQCFEYAESYRVLFLIEDDIYLSRSAFSFGYQAALFYDSFEEVAGISLYNFESNWLNWGLRFEPLKANFDNYYMRIAQSWGEVITTKQWLIFKEWLRKNPVFVKDELNVPSMNAWPDSSWLKFFTRYCILENKFFVYPYCSLSSNFNGSGSHNKMMTSDYQTTLPIGYSPFSFCPLKPSDKKAITYDEYMNPLFLIDVIKRYGEDITIDLWCTKRKSLFKKYVLTCGYYGKQFVESFSLSIHPAELSIVDNISGFGIYIYESDYIKKKKPNLFNLKKYSLRISDWRKINFFSLKLFFGTIRNCLRKRIK